jgi:hypothetical protein
MSFDWSQYLRLAEELAGQVTVTPCQEAKRRSSVSRSYYAAFCTARNHLRDVDKLVIPRKDTHKFVVDAFKNSPDTSRRQIGTSLDRLRVERTQTDYDDTVDTAKWLPSTTMLALMTSQQTISDIASL